MTMYVRQVHFMMASHAPCILPNANHCATGGSLGPDVGLVVGEVRLIIVRIRLDVIEDTGPDVVKIRLKNITMQVVNEGEFLVEIGV